MLKIAFEKPRNRTDIKEIESGESLEISGIEMTNNNPLTVYVWVVSA